jgi:hypothetical protein
MDLDGERDQSKWRLAPTEQSVGHMGSMCLAYKMVYVDILYIYILYIIIVKRSEKELYPNSDVYSFLMTEGKC